MIKTMYFNQFCIYVMILVLWPVALVLLTYVLETWLHDNMPHMQLNIVWGKQEVLFH